VWRRSSTCAALRSCENHQEAESFSGIEFHPAPIETPRKSAIGSKKKAKRKLKNYKLKHSRLLTCYSALAYLLAVFATRQTVTPDDARKMVSSTPTALGPTDWSSAGAARKPHGCGFTSG
jgi:hypothetical protein